MRGSTGLLDSEACRFQGSGTSGLEGSRILDLPGFRVFGSRGLGIHNTIKYSSNIIIIVVLITIIIIIAIIIILIIRVEGFRVCLFGCLSGPAFPGKQNKDRSPDK